MAQYGLKIGFATDVAPDLVVGEQIATLSVVSESGSGARPYVATVLPLRGQVPSGSYLSNVAGTETGNVLSTHDDGSAAVVVFASEASATGTVALHVATGTAPSALSTSAISSQISSVAVAFGSPYGTASITNFSSPEFVWWSTSKTICARYRVAAPTPGSTALEAVVDIHAWADRALVEVVVENSKMTTATPTKPDAASYTGATVSINGGAAISTVNSTDMPTELAHSAFRSWYTSGWVGAGSTGLRVTQLHSELQLHPLLFKCDQAATFDMAGYASDAYVPWTTGRQRASGMGDGGDHPSIGPLPQWEARALQSGDYRAWQATEVSALAVLGYNVNYRDTTTGLVPTISELAGKTQQSNWPKQTNGSDVMGWETAHHPAAGLMAFIGRPSPVFIELAQKVAVWNATLTTFEDVGPLVTTGVFGQYYQMRGRAWGIRSLAHAIFLTPTALPWKAAGKTSLAANATYLNGWRTDSKALLNCFWDYTAAGTLQDAAGDAGFQAKVWQHHYLTTELHKAASAGLLTGADQTALDTIADWAALQAVRWVTEQPNGGWRYVPYHTTIGRSATTIDSAADWATQMAWSMTDSPTATVWKTDYSGATRTTYASFDTTDTGGTGYPGYFWSALVAAAERQVAGYSDAWWTVQVGISNLSTWLTAFASDPRHGSTPKVIPPAVGFADGADAGTYNSTTKVWVPGKTSGVVNAASWAIVPTGEWVEISGSRIDTLTTEIVAAGLGWNSTTLAWRGTINAWNGLAIDQDGSRVWLVAAGGHADSSNNGVYRFECFKMAWAVERMPSDRNAWSTQYKTLAAPQAGTYTSCYESHVATPQAALGEEAATATTRKYLFDQLFWDARPTSRHVYSAAVYIPATNELVSGCRSMWHYSIDSGDWTYNKRFDRVVDQAEIMGVHDEVTGEYLFSGMGDGVKASLSYSISAKTFGSWSCPWIGDPWQNVADTRHGRSITVWSPPFSDRPAHNWLVYNLDSRTATTPRVAPTYAGGLSSASFVSTGSPAGNGPALCYIPPLDEYWILYYLSAGMTWLKMDPTTNPPTLSPKSFTGTLPTVDDKPGRKLVWMPDLNAVMLWSKDDRGAYVYKF